MNADQLQHLERQEAQYNQLQQPMRMPQSGDRPAAMASLARTRELILSSDDDSDEDEADKKFDNMVQRYRLAAKPAVHKNTIIRFCRAFPNIVGKNKVSFVIGAGADAIHLVGWPAGKSVRVTADIDAATSTIVWKGKSYAQPKMFLIDAMKGYPNCNPQNAEHWTRFLRFDGFTLAQLRDKKHPPQQAAAAKLPSQQPPRPQHAGQKRSATQAALAETKQPALHATTMIKLELTPALMQCARSPPPAAPAAAPTAPAASAPPATPPLAKWTAEQVADNLVAQCGRVQAFHDIASKLVERKVTGAVLLSLKGRCVKALEQLYSDIDLFACTSAAQCLEQIIVDKA